MLNFIKILPLLAFTLSISAAGARADVHLADSSSFTDPADVATPVKEAGSLIVNTTGPDDDFDGKTTLREAVEFARTDGTDAPVTFDTKVFAAPRKTILVVGDRIDLFDGEPVTILGPPAGVEIRGDGTTKLFFVGVDGSLTLRGLTLTNGRAAIGAAIATYGNLVVDGCTFVDNQAQTKGGAIYVDAVRANASAIIRNSTFSGNSAGDYGGAIYNGSLATELNSLTIVGNSAGANGGGGIASLGGFDAKPTVTNCIIAANTASGSANDVQIVDGPTNTFVSGGFNHIGEGNGKTAFVAGGDSIGGDASGVGPLAENGGPTPTRLPLANSTLVDQGKTALTIDQRGVTRPQGRAADQGAVEVIQTAVAVSLSPAAPRTKDTLTATASASGAGSSALTYAYVWKKNGNVIPGESAATLDLSKPGNGDKNDVIACEVTATSASGGAATAAQVTVVNSAPIAISSQGTVDVATEKGFVLNAFDADGDALTFKRVGGPVNGVTADIRVDPIDGKLKLFYKSRPKYGGVDIIRFVAFDSDNKQSNESTLGIKVLYTPPPPANRAPIAGDTNIDTYVGVSEIKGLLGSDPDGDAITFRIVNNAKYGSSEIKRDTDGQFKLFYTSLNRFYGPDRVTYVVTDSRGADSNLATVNINFTDRAPVAQGNKIGVASGVEVSQYLFGTDADGDALTFRLVNNPRYGKGEVKLDPQGKWRFYYTSLPGYVGPDQITFIAIDPQGKQSQVAAIDINVVRISGSASGALQRGVAPSAGGS